MEDLILEIVPELYDEIASLLTSLGEFFAGGVVITFIFWTVGFTIGEVFKVLDTSTREGG